MVRLGLDSPAAVPGFQQLATRNSKFRGQESLAVGCVRVPVFRPMTVLVPYRGGHGILPCVSATDVFAPVGGNIEALRIKIVLAGASAPGQFDLRPALIAKMHPAVAIHASPIAPILDGTIKGLPPYVLRAEVALLLLTGFAMTVLLPLLSPIRATLLTALALACPVALNLEAWIDANLVLLLVPSLLMVALLCALNMFYGYFNESRAKRQIAGRFGQYVPPALVEELVRHPELQFVKPPQANTSRALCKRFIQRTAAYRRNSPGNVRDGIYRFEAN
jgi:adenylate cyclase